MSGKVKWFSAKRGYGFIAGEDGSDYFAHHSEIRMDGFRNLHRGQAVTFAVRTDEQGRLCAQDIVPVD